MRRLLLLALFFSACEKAPKPKERPPSAVRAETVVQTPTRLYVNTYGHGNAYLNVDIRSQVEGILTDVFFNDGQELKQGDLLCFIDKRPFEAALKNQEAVLAENLAQLKYAEDTAKRYTTLVQDEYVSQLNYEQYLTNAYVYEALVKSSKALVETAAINLSYCTIQSPIDGLASELEVDAGNLVVPNTTLLLTVRQISPIYVNFILPEYELPRVQRCLKKGAVKVIAQVDELTFEEGTLDFIENTVDTATGTIALRAIFDNKEKNIWPGQYVNVRVMLETIEDALIIPSLAVQLSQAGKFVYVVKDQTVEQRPITEVAELGDVTVVCSGLDEGEQVVTEGQFNLFPGAKITIKKNDDASTLPHGR